MNGKEKKKDTTQERVEFGRLWAPATSFPSLYLRILALRRSVAVQVVYLHMSRGLVTMDVWRCKMWRHLNGIHSDA